MEKRLIKEVLMQKCRDYANERFFRAREAMKEAQEAANEETKSSAGDKYNTDRALMQIERDNHAKQLAEAQLFHSSLDLVNVKKMTDQVDLGCLVETDNGNYFISISAGKMDVDGFTVVTISLASPLGQQLKGKKTGAQVEFNSKKYTILQIT